MPYKNKEQDRTWHKLKMRRARTILKLHSRFVTPDVTPKRVEVDADGNVIPEL